MVSIELLLSNCQGKSVVTRTDLGTLLAQAAVEEGPVELTRVALHVEACLVLAVNETERLPAHEKIFQILT